MSPGVFNDPLQVEHVYFAGTLSQKGCPKVGGLPEAARQLKG